MRRESEKGSVYCVVRNSAVKMFAKQDLGGYIFEL
jgi:hypothetical protein